MTEVLEKPAGMGHNNPPTESKLDAWTDHAESLRERAVGIHIKDDATAELVAELITDAKKAAKDVEASVKAERKPHTDAAAAVSASYKPVLASIAAVKDAAVKVAGEWRAKKEAEAAEAAKEARRIAAEKELEAARIAAQADTTEADDLAKAREAEEAAKVAKMDAKKASTAKVASGGVRMMSRHSVEIIDRKALLFHVAEHAPESLAEFLHTWADGAARSGVDDIPGVTVKRWREPV